MLQLSFDGRRLYVTNSLYSTWDNQFYPELRSWLLRVDCDPNGGMEIDHDFFVDFHDRPGRARARARGAAPGRRLHDGDLPVILAHVMGLPVEETVLQAVAARRDDAASRSESPCCVDALGPPGDAAEAPLMEAAIAAIAAEEAAVVAVALDYFEGWFEGDTARMDRALHPELAKRSLSQVDRILAS